MEQELPGLYKPQFLIWVTKHMRDPNGIIIPRTEIHGGMRFHWPALFSQGSILLGQGKVETSHSLNLDLAMRNVQGIVFGEEKPNQFTIITDRFGTLPVYLYQTVDTIAIFLHYDAFFENVHPRLTLDLAGFWELLLLDGALAGRTLFSEVRQLPPASIIRVNLEQWTVMTDRYYNLSFSPTVFSSSENIAEQVVDAISKVFTTLPSEKKILLPLSGGIDSRFLAALLTTFVEPNPIQAVTFAYDPRSYEYAFAQKVCQITGIRDHYFHKLISDSYLQALPAFSQNEGGRISIAHCHLYDFLLKNTSDWSEYILVSGMFADAIAGYGVSSRPESGPEESSLYARLEHWNKRLDFSQWFPHIIGDLYEIFRQWQQGSSVTSFTEYTYLTQRQQSLLFPLAEVYSRQIRVLMPFTDPDLADIMFGLPYEWRHFKAGMRTAIGYLSPMLANIRDTSSKPIQKSLFDQMWFWFSRFSNYRSVIMSLISGDRIRVVDPFQTEIQGTYLRREHSDLLHQALEDLTAMDIITQKQSKQLGAKHYRSYWFTPQYRAISLSATLRYLQDAGILMHWK